MLWDADGVLQDLPPIESLWTFLPEPLHTQLLVETVYSESGETLTGEVDMAERVEAAIRKHGLEAHRDDLLAVWTEFPPVEEGRALLREVRASGVVCVLASNQDTLRAANMRPIYEPLLDRLYLSPEVGLAKPDPAFFTHIAADLGLLPTDLVFIDDTRVNVDGAAAAGVHAIHWHFSQGVSELRSRLIRAGVTL